MLVFWEQRLVFLATPKTGSTALAAALEPLATLSLQRPPVLKHTTAQRFHRFLGPYLRVSSGEDFETCALMREPIDWLGSWYRFRRREALEDETLSTKAMRFEDFALDYCREDRPEHANVGSQARFLAPPNKPPVDRIFRYEAMEDFVAFLEDRLACAITLPQLNVSPQADMALSPSTRRALTRVMARDFELYQTLSAG